MAGSYGERRFRFKRQRGREGPRQYFEFTALVAFLLFWLGIFGAGRWSVGHMISRQRERVVATPAVAH